jgi:repressor LexA
MNKIKILRIKKGLKQEELSKIINVSQASLSGYENGKYEPDNKTLLHLAAYFGVSTDYLLGNEDVPESFAKQDKKIPVFRHIRAEWSAEAAKEILGYEEISEDMARQGDFFALKVHGDSMEPRIQDGDVVIMHKQSEVESGDVAAVSVCRNEATIQKIVKYESGVTLISYNPKYDPVSYSKADVIRLPVIIMGKAVELRGKC